MMEKEGGREKGRDREGEGEKKKTKEGGRKDEIDSRLPPPFLIHTQKQTDREYQEIK